MPVFTARIERKQDDLPRYLIVGFDPTAVWGSTTTCLVTGNFGGAAFERRSIVPWGDGRWFMSLPEPLCREAGVDAGDEVTVGLSLPDNEAPDDLASALAAARVIPAWESLHGTTRRDVILKLCEAKTPATRARRIGEALERLGVFRG